MLLSKKILVCVFFAGFLLAGCGGSPGGSGGSSNPGQPTADFSIAINPQSLTMGTGSSQMGTVSISPANGFNGSVNISTATLPAGVSVFPSSFTIASNASQTVTFTVSPSADPASSTITFQATAAGLSHSATVQLNVTLMASGPHAPIRARYLRTNSYYDPNYLEFAPPHFTVYDPIH